MDLVALRALLRSHVVALSDAATHKTLPDIWRGLGLPVTDIEGSKRERMIASFDAVPASGLEAVALQFLRHHPPGAATRNDIQDALWALKPALDVSKRYRRDVARAIDGDEFLAAQPFVNLLDA